MKFLVVSALLTLVATCRVAAANSQVDALSQARGAALGELSRLSREGSHGLNASDFAGARLGTPFLYYGTDSTFMDYENAEAQDILRYVKRRSQFFPVFAGDRFLGAIKVRPGRDGKLLAYFGPLDPQVIADLEKLSHEALL